MPLYSYVYPSGVLLFEEQCKQGQSVTAAKFETFAETWLKDYAEITVKRTTMCVYRELVKRIYPVIGHIRIDKISPLNIQKLVQTLSSEGMSPRTIKTYVRFVSGILNYAIKKRLITYNSRFYGISYWKQAQDTITC